MTLSPNGRVRVHRHGKGMAVACSVMMRDALIGVGWHLITVALGMRLSTAGDCRRVQRLARVQCPCRRQRTGEQCEQEESPTARHRRCHTGSGPRCHWINSRPQVSGMSDRDIMSRDVR